MFRCYIICARAWYAPKSYTHMSSKRKKLMFLTNGITQQDIDEAVELKAIIETAIGPTHPDVSFEMLLLWWLTVDPAEA